MDFHFSKDNGEDKCSMNNNQHEKWGEMEESDVHALREQDESYSQRGESHEFTEWQSPKDYGDGNADIFNLQRLAMEHRKSPFPDFQFDVLDNEGDTDDNGCEYNLATGTRKKPPTRMDSWEDNWLFQQRKCNSRASTDGRNTLMSMKMYGTIDEQKDQGTEDYEKDESDASECSADCKTNELQRVERPCVRTSSSSSDVEDSEGSESSESHSRNVKSCSNDSDEKIPFLESNPSTSDNSDSTDRSGKARQLHEKRHMEDVPSIGKHFTKERTNNFPKNSSMEDLLKIKERQYSEIVLKTQEPEEADSDDSIKDELVKSDEDKLSCSQSDNPLLPTFLIERSCSPRPVSGIRSCTSEDSSSDEFEKKAAAYKSRRRASWCPIETPPIAAKKRGKRRTPIHALRVDEDDPELEIKPLSTDEEALVGLERQMLHRDAHHSSFRAKKASPNFILNPLYVPEGEGAHNPRGLDLVNNPNAMQHLQPTKSESGYSSCSPDSMMSQNVLLPPRDRKFHPEGRHDALNPTQHRMQPNQRVAPADPESSFLW